MMTIQLVYSLIPNVYSLAKNYIHMKNYIFIIALFAINTACKNGEVPTTGIEGSVLTIEEIKTFLPSSYKNESNIVFINAAGALKTLSVNYVEGTSEGTHENSTYTSEKLAVILFDPDNTTFQIKMNSSANYGHSGTVVKGLNTFLMPNHPNMNFVRVSFENGQPTISLLDKFEETVSLLNKDFSDVYVNHERHPPAEAFSDLMVNSEFGVIAFSDENGELWVFDRFEE